MIYFYIFMINQVNHKKNVFRIKKELTLLTIFTFNEELNNYIIFVYFKLNKYKTGYFVIFAFY